MEDVNDSEIDPEDDTQCSSDYYPYDSTNGANVTDETYTKEYLQDIPISMRYLLDNDNIFHETKAFNSARTNLDKFGSVAIIGPRGSGKSSIAVRLLKENNGKTIKGKRYVSKFTFSIENLEEFVDPSCITILYMSDVLEECTYLKSHCLKAYDIFERLHAKFVSRKLLYVVLTVTDSAWTKFLQGIKVCSGSCKLFPNAQSVQVLHSNDDEKETILMNHLLNKGFEITSFKQEENKMDFLDSISYQPLRIDKDSIKRLVKSLSGVAKRDNIGFQVVFQTIANNTLLFQAKENIQRYGFMESLKTLFNEMSISSDSRNKDIFCVLAFMALNDGLISADRFQEQKTIYENICSYSVTKVKGWKDVETLLECHMKSYVYPVSTDCYILHNSIYTEAIVAALTLSPKGIQIFIENCSGKELLKRIRRNKLKEKEDFVLRLSPNLYDLVINRLLLEAENNPSVTNILCDHLIMESENFSSLWKSAWSWHQSMKRCSAENHESHFQTDGDSCFKNGGLAFEINHF